MEGLNTLLLNSVDSLELVKSFSLFHSVHLQSTRFVMRSSSIKIGKFLRRHRVLIKTTGLKQIRKFGKTARLTGAASWEATPGLYHTRNCFWVYLNRSRCTKCATT